MFMSEDAMIVGDAMNRIEEVLNEKPLSESKVNNVPSDHSITLEHVIYSYDVRKTHSMMFYVNQTGTDNRISRLVRRRQDDPCKYCYKIF